MKKLTRSVVVGLLFVAFFAGAAPRPGLLARPVAVQAQATASALRLEPCKLSVGLGEAKREVDARCGELSVPENWSKPDGRKIEVYVMVLPATIQEAKGLPVFHFEGGPGGAAIDRFGLIWYSAYRQLYRDHDIVIIDQRGTGRSTSLQCTETTDNDLADLEKAETDDEAEATALKRLQVCFRRVSEKTDPANYTTNAIADDIDAVRKALGYDKIEVYGSSYGTWLGQIYLRRHGESVAAMVLDSVAGPWNFYLLDAANNAEASLDRIFEMCKADQVCNKAYPDLPGQLQKALDQLQKDPIKTSATGQLTNKTYPVTITRSRLLTALFTMLYQSSLIGSIPQVVSDAANGKFLLPALMLVARAEEDALSLGLYYSIHCAESAPFYTDDLIKKYARGSFYGFDRRPGDNLRAVCNVWRSAELDEADVAPVKSDRPVLVLAGEFDPVTATAFAKETNQRLSKSTLAVFPYQSHGPMASSKCAQNMVAAFFKAPEKPVDTSCAARDIRPIFGGTYRVETEPYTDAARNLKIRIPKGWQFQAPESSDAMSFFASADGTQQLLGVGIFKEMTVEKAQQAAIEAVMKGYGAFQPRATLNSLGIQFTEHELDRPDATYTGVFVVFQARGTTYVVWHAAPSNIFLTVYTAVVTSILPSLMGR